MRFGQKIFLVSFALIIIAINGIGIIMINQSYKENVQREIEKSVIQINSIMTEINAGMNTLAYIGSSYWKNNVKIKLYDQAKMIYTNFKDEYPEIEDKLLTQEDKKTLDELIEEMAIEKDGAAQEKGKTNAAYLINVGGGSTKSEENNIKVYIEDDKLFTKLRRNTKVIITLADISKVNDMKEEQIDYFVALSLGSSFVIALILSSSVSFLTRKIKLLNKMVKEVEQGNYEAKVKKLGNDEIGNVGKSFNNMTQAIQKNIEEIQTVSENRKQFIGNLTHEIRTPLTSIIGYSSLVKSGKVTKQEDVIEYCHKIHEEGRYIEKISQKLMDLLLVENGNIEVEEMNLSEEVYKITNELQETFPDVTYQIEIVDSVFVKADKVLLKSLIFNLVKNAIGAYKENAIVRIEVNRNKELKVVDYGKGIPDSEIEKIKEPFYTLSQDRNRSFSGMGLGLPLCMKIVEVLKGTLEIESRENKGTSITVKLGDRK